MQIKLANINRWKLAFVGKRWRELGRIRNYGPCTKEIVTTYISMIIVIQEYRLSVIISSTCVKEVRNLEYFKIGNHLIFICWPFSFSLPSSVVKILQETPVWPGKNPYISSLWPCLKEDEVKMSFSLYISE